eukprot:3056117-Rhodomonas_salina.1
MGGLSARPSATVFLQCVDNGRKRSGLLRCDIRFDASLALAAPDSQEVVDGLFVALGVKESLLADAVQQQLRFLFWVLTADGSMSCIGTVMLFEDIRVGESTTVGIGAGQMSGKGSESCREKNGGNGSCSSEPEKLITQLYTDMVSTETENSMDGSCNETGLASDLQENSTEGEELVFEDACSMNCNCKKCMGGDYSRDAANVSGFEASMIYRGCSRCNAEKGGAGLTRLGIG